MAFGVGDARLDQDRVSVLPGRQDQRRQRGPTITTTFRCPGGTLKVQFAPTQPSLVQSAVWEVVRGTGTFEGLRGGSTMVAKFESDDPVAAFRRKQ